MDQLIEIAPRFISEGLINELGTARRQGRSFHYLELDLKLIESVFAFILHRWLDVWLHRLRNLSPWVHAWLSHQARDAYWQHGSICEDYTRIKCPVFLVGGWVDLYTNRVFRLMQHLDAPVRALVGPWGHQWPMNATPGPQIDFLSESLRWWDHHLKGLPSGIMEEPGLRIYLRDGTLKRSVLELPFSSINPAVSRTKLTQDSRGWLVIWQTGGCHVAKSVDRSCFVVVIEPFC